MNYSIVIAGIQFHIESEVPFRFSEEDKLFFSDQPGTVRTVNVMIRRKDSLPELIADELYHESGFRIGFDTDGNEVKQYYAHFLPGQPCYAVSRYKGGNIEIDYFNASYLINTVELPLWNLLHMESIFLECSQFVFHCSYLMYRGKAILFSAPSGTGKTTQAKLWEKNLPGAKIINGDKTCMRRKSDGKWYACGYPFHGTADECLNEDYPISSIAVVRQSPDNFIEEMSVRERIFALYSECTVPSWKEDAAGRMLDLLSGFIAEVPVVRLCCNMEDAAAFTLFNYLKDCEVI